MLMEMLRDPTYTELSIIHSRGLSFPFCKLGRIPALPVYVMGIEGDNIRDHKESKHAVLTNNPSSRFKPTLI